MSTSSLSEALRRRDLPHLITGREAAWLLGFSVGRWRQITGNQDIPHPILGAPTFQKGVRGAQWQLENVLALAAQQGRELPVPVPPLIPMPDRPRYVSVSAHLLTAHHPHDASPVGSRHAESVMSTYNSSPLVWAEMFRPQQEELCGYAEPGLMVVTPIWPLGPVWNGMADFIYEALTIINWRSALPSGSADKALAMTVAVLPVLWSGSSDWESPIRDVRVVDVTVGQCRPDRDVRWMYSRAGDSRRPWNPWHDTYRVSAFNLAACIGIDALPFWPRATNTAANVAAWAPGLPVEVAVPADLTARWSAAQWLLHQAKTMGDPGGPLRSLARALLENYRADQEDDVKIPHGWEAAAVVQLPELPAADRTVSWMEALNGLIGSDRPPPHVTDALIEYIGDPGFARPALIQLDTLPGYWAESLRLGSTEWPIDREKGARIRRLRRVADESTIHDQGDLVTLGHSMSPAVLSSTHLTWCPPTSLRPFESDRPEVALPSGDSPIEVLLVRDPLTQLVRGWVRTASGSAHPLPAEPPYLQSAFGLSQTFRALARNTDLYPLPFVAEPDSQHFARLARAVQPSQPLVMPWQEFVAIAGQAPPNEFND